MIEPDIMSCPLGSNISALRTQSWSRTKISRRSPIGRCGSSGPPPATRRTGLPQVWASMQKKLFLIFSYPRSPRLRQPAAVEQAAGQPVEQQGDGNDCQACSEAEPHFHARQAARHFRAEPARTHETGEHNHRQRQQDALVEPDQQRLLGKRHLDLPQDRAGRCADGAAELDEHLRHLVEGKRRQTQHRRNAIDDGGDDRRHASEAEDHHRRNEIDPWRHGLHHVENRANRRLQCLIARTEYADRKGDENGDHDGDGDQRKRLHRRRPQSDKQAEAEAEAGDDGGAQADGKECRRDDDRDQRKRRHEEKCGLDGGKHRFDHIADGRKQRMKVGVEPIDGRGQESAGRKLQVRNIHDFLPVPKRAALCVIRSITMVNTTMAIAALIEVAISSVLIAP
ncbi:hypothetical protein RHECNPAF_7300103 [Rhizobium etli CNPAF512]|nr:hypothetical protein RHECNPAF_7300103 [Rhizobium etli CNPAF512]